LWKAGKGESEETFFEMKEWDNEENDQGGAQVTGQPDETSSVEKTPEPDDKLAYELEKAVNEPISSANLLNERPTLPSTIVCRHDVPDVMEVCVKTSPANLEKTKLAIVDCCSSNGSLYVNVADVDQSKLIDVRKKCIDRSGVVKCPEKALEMKARRIEGFQAIKDVKLAEICESGTMEDHEITLRIDNVIMEYLNCSDVWVERDKFAALYHYILFKSPFLTDYKIRLLTKSNGRDDFNLNNSSLLSENADYGLALGLYQRIKDGNYAKALLIETDGKLSLAD
jgi:hypothetical protein